MKTVKSPSARERTVVIGAGFAGLSAATALAEAGVGVHLLEARPSLGGRANAFRDPITGERIDNGQHVLAGCYLETLRFLTRIGARQHLHWPSTLRVPMIDRAGRRSELVLPPLPSPVDLVAAALAWDALTSADRLSLLRIGRALQGASLTAPHETVRQWLVRHGQTARLCELLWEPLALAALNQPIDEAAAASFVAVMVRMFASGPDGATILVPAVPLDDLYTHPARRFLERSGSTVRTHAKAQVVFRAGGVEGVRIGDESIPARLVICAVPWHTLAAAVPSAPDALASILANATALPGSPIVTVNLWLEDDGFDEPFVGLPGRTFQWVFGRRILLGTEHSHLSLVSSGAAAIAAASNDEVTAIAVRELREAFPARGRVRHSLVIRERQATFSLRPGSPPRPPTVTPVAGLLLAGDWIDTGLPGTIESAVVAGHAAAAAALRLLDREPAGIDRAAFTR